MMRTVYLLFFIFIFSVGCDKINEVQHGQIVDSMDCYKEMNEKLTSKSYQTDLENLSSQIFWKKGKPLYIPDAKYTLIPREQIFSLLQIDTNNQCRQKLDSLGDFAGIRFITSDYISYDVCRIERNYGKFSGAHHPKETHRLIYNRSKQKFKKADFLEDNELLTHYEKIDDNWTYVVSTMN